MLDAILQWSPLGAVKELTALGGWIVWWLGAACLVMWAVIVERYWYFNRVLPAEAAGMLEVWRARRDHRSWCSRQIRRAMISRLNAGMTKNLQVLRVLVPMCPLLGLIGTVGGMLEVFDAMAMRGNADARAMASGVGQAMTATMAGLFVSITGLFPLYRYQQRAQDETELLADKFEY